MGKDACYAHVRVVRSVCVKAELQLMSSTLNATAVAARRVLHQEVNGGREVIGSSNTKQFLDVAPTCDVHVVSVIKDTF